MHSLSKSGEVEQLAAGLQEKQKLLQTALAEVSSFGIDIVYEV